MNFKNNRGFTLIEVMITIVVLFVGILAMTMMQVRAIKGNQSAFSRSSASSVALTFMEELFNLPFDTVSSTAGGNLDAGSAALNGGTPAPANADNVFNPAVLTTLSNMYSQNGNNVVDQMGNEYQLFWNVSNTTVTINTLTYTPSCTIRLFMYWNTPDGRNSLVITAVKQNS